MEVALFEKIAREASLHKSLRAFKLLGSGEITLHPQLPELMEITRRYGVPTFAYTNGSLLQSFPHREILSWNLDTLVVSADGLDAESYERFKLGGRYDRLRTAIADFYNGRKSLGLAKPIIEIRHVMVPSESTGQLLTVKKEWEGISDRVKFQYLEPATGLWDFKDNPKCRSFRREMGIWWDGTTPLCRGYWNIPLGNVRDSDIAELWRHPKIEQMRKYHNSRDFTQVPVCFHCRCCA